MRSYPQKIAEWKVADKKTRITHFGPGVIRTALDKRDGYTSGLRKRAYDLLSEHASHASYPGFTLVVTGDQNLGQVGPFFDAKKLAVLISELAMRMVSAALNVAADHEGMDHKLLATRSHYLDVVNAWRARYLK